MDGGGGGARAHHLRDPQHGADAVGEIVVLAGEHAVEQRHGGEFLAARVEQEAQLGGGEQIVGRVLGEDAKLGFGLGFAAHAQQQVAQFAAQLVIGRVQRQRLAELADERVACGQEFAGHFGGARFAPVGGGQQRGGGVAGAPHGQPDAAQVHQHGAPVGEQAPGAFEMRGGERQFVALFGQGGEFEMPAEVIAAEQDRALPSRDPGRQGVVDIVEGLLGGGVPGAAQAVEDAARLGLLFGLVAEEGVLQGGGGVGRVQAHGLAKLVARQRGLADLEVGVGQVLADVGPGGCGLDGGEKGGHRDIVIARAQGGVCAV